jgi:hypothetical protein
MFGENRKPIVLRCCACHLWVAMRVDPEDVRRCLDGMFVRKHLPTAKASRT